jgi:hypothetical protein
MVATVAETAITLAKHATLVTRIKPVTTHLTARHPVAMEHTPVIVAAVIQVVLLLVAAVALDH